jgi:hypothetical protein
MTLLEIIISFEAVFIICAVLAIVTAQEGQDGRRF